MKAKVDNAMEWKRKLRMEEGNHLELGLLLRQILSQFIEEFESVEIVGTSDPEEI